MYDSRKNKSEFQVVKKVSIIHSSNNNNNSARGGVIGVVNGGFDCGGNNNNSQVKKKEEEKSYLRRITVSRKKKRRRLFGGIVEEEKKKKKKPMPSLVAAVTSFLPLTSSSEASSPTSQAGNPTIGILVADAQEMNSSATLSHGLISVVGRRRSMEDAVTVVPSLVHVTTTTTFDFFAVYDGHGGYAVASRCKERMHHLVAAEISAEMERNPAAEVVDWERVMGSSFARMDEEVAEDATEDPPAVKAAVGSTALVVVVGKEEVVVANCGDCRAVLGTGGGAALALSHDHKPERPDEKERVEAAGGNVVNWNCSRVLGVLATSRSIGDYYLKPYVTAEPEVTVHKQTLSDEFLVIASDGLWDVVSNELACELVRKCFCGHVKRKMYEEFNGSCAAAAAAMLAELAIARGSRDNISVIVVELQPPSSSSSTSTSTSAASTP